MANSAGSDVGVLIGQGDGTFQPQVTFSTGVSPLCVAVADVNGDGNQDIVTANYGTHTVSVLLGSGNGSFLSQQTFATAIAPTSVAIADVSGDGKPDLVVANKKDSSVGVLLGNGDGSFAAQETFAAGPDPFSIAVADVNGDGHRDIVVANYSNNSVGILLGNGDGTFAPQQTFATAANPFFVSLADVNGDGAPDVLAADYSAGSVSVLLRNLAPQVQSIVRTLPVGPIDTLPSVTYTVTFSKPVMGVDPSDFALALSGVTATTPVEVAGTGSIYTVTVNGVSGAGTLGLNVVNDGSIQDFSNQPLMSANLMGQLYDVNTTGTQSFLQSAASGKLPTIALVAGEKTKPIHLNIKLINSSANVATGPVTVQLALSTNPAGTSTDPVEGTLSRKVRIRPGKNSPFGAVTIRALPIGLTGTLYLLLKLTDANGDTNLNSAGTLTAAPPFIDLSAQNVATAPKARLGKKLTASVTIKQDGNIPLIGAVPIELLLSGDTSEIGAIDLGQFTAHAALQPGRQAVLHLRATVPVSAAPGTYRLIAQIDPNNLLNDINPADNLATSVKTVAVG